MSDNAMLIVAIAVMAIGSFGVGAAVLLEMKAHEPIWKLMMKIFPWVCFVGGVLLAVAMAGS